MKKIVINLVMLLIMIMSLAINFIMPTYAMEYDTYELQFTIKNNPEEKEVELYLLLPKEYILFAIEKTGLEIEYDGANTLKDNTITGIDVDKENVQDKIYEEKGIEYIKIKLDEKDEGNYVFDILSDLPLFFSFSVEIV